MIPIYKGRRRQKGYGIGGTFASLFRKAVPLLKSTGFAVGKEALRAGGDAFEALEAGDQPWQSIAKTHGKRAAKRAIQPVLSNAGKFITEGFKDIFSDPDITLPSTKRERTTEHGDIFDS